MKGYWYKVINSELYQYKKKSDEKHKTMQALTGVFIREEPSEPLDESTQIFSFTLIFPSKERTFYLQNKKDYDSWITVIKRAIGYQNILDHYELGNKIGRGKFGLVKLAKHIKT